MEFELDITDIKVLYHNAVVIQQVDEFGEVHCVGVVTTSDLVRALGLLKNRSFSGIALNMKGEEI